MSTGEKAREILNQERRSESNRQASMVERTEPQAENADEQADITQQRARELANQTQIDEEKRQGSMSERMEEAIEKSPVAKPDNPD